MEEQLIGRKKPVGYMLMGIYMNLFLVFSIWTYPLWGYDNFIIWLIPVLLAFISWVANIVLTVLNIKNAYWLYSNKESIFLKKYMSALKLGAVPYFIINFIFCAGLIFAVVASSRGLIIFSPIPILFIIPIFLTYGTVVSTSFYGLFFIASVLKEDKITIGKAIVHMLLQICFVLDIVDTIALLIIYREKKNKN